MPQLEQRSKTRARPGKILTSHRREHAKQGLSAFRQAGAAKKPS